MPFDFLHMWVHNVLFAPVSQHWVTYFDGVVLQLYDSGVLYSLLRKS